MLRQIALSAAAPWRSYTFASSDRAAVSAAFAVTSRLASSPAQRSSPLSKAACAAASTFAGPPISAT